MATTGGGIYFPQGSDAFAPHTDMQAQAVSLSGRVIIPVANTTDRDAVYSDLVSDGDVVAGDPVFVHRADAGAGREVEYTTNGSTWRTVEARTAAVARLERVSTQSIPTGVFTTTVGWGFAGSSNGFSYANGDLTFPSSGVYLITCAVAIASNSSGIRDLLIGGLQMVRTNATNGSQTIMSAARVVQGSGITGAVQVRQNSGGSLNLEGGYIDIVRIF